MTAEELIAALDAIHEKQQRGGSDIEGDHIKVDDLLLDYINDERVREAYERLSLWYA